MEDESGAYKISFPIKESAVELKTIRERELRFQQWLSSMILEIAKKERGGARDDP